MASIFFVLARIYRNHIQIELSKKEKTFSDFFGPLLKSASNSKHFERKDKPRNLCISEITDCDKPD